jgi:hypothetical protein
MPISRIGVVISLAALAEDRMLSQKTSIIRLHYIDNDLARSTCQVNFSAGTDPSTLLSQVSSWQAIISALSSAICIETDVIVRYSDPSQPSAGISSNGKRSGTFIYDNDAASFVVLRVPSIRNELVLSSGPYAGVGIDVDDADVSAYIDAVINGISGVEVCDPFDSDIVSLSSAFVEQY